MKYMYYLVAIHTTMGTKQYYCGPEQWATLCGKTFFRDSSQPANPIRYLTEPLAHETALLVRALEVPSGCVVGVERREVVDEVLRSHEKQLVRHTQAVARELSEYPYDDTLWAKLNAARQQMKSRKA